MKTINELLPLVKANKNTYYNLDKDTKNEFKKLYNEVKEYKKCTINPMQEKHFFDKLNDNTKLEYTKKYNALYHLRLFVVR